MPRSGHIADLREAIGSRLLLMPSVSTSVIDAHGRVLLVCSSDEREWSTPGGAIEPGEHPADAALREVWEETGLQVDLLGLVGVFGGPDMELHYDNGDRTIYVTTAFLARPLTEEIELDLGEVRDARWLGAQQWPSLPTPVFVPQLLRASFALHAALHTGEEQLVTYVPPTWSPPGSCATT